MNSFIKAKPLQQLKNGIADSTFQVIMGHHKQIRQRCAHVHDRKTPGIDLSAWQKYRTVQQPMWELHRGPWFVGDDSPWEKSGTNALSMSWHGKRVVPILRQPCLDKGDWSHLCWSQQHWTLSKMMYYSSPGCGAGQCRWCCYSQMKNEIGIKCNETWMELNVERDEKWNDWK